MMVRLTAAVETAARAGHDFNRLIVGFAVLDPFEQPAGVSQTGTDRDVQLETIDLDRRLLDALKAANRGEFDLLKILPGDPVGRGAAVSYSHIRDHETIAHIVCRRVL